MNSNRFLFIFSLFASTALYADPACENLSSDKQPEKQKCSYRHIISHVETSGSTSSVDNDAKEELIQQHFSNGVFFTRDDIIALTGLDTNAAAALLERLTGYGRIIKIGHSHNVSYRLATTQEIEERQISIDEAVAQITPISDLEQAIIEHPLWLENIAYGVPRPGHPEGAIIFHIHDVLDNVESKYANSPYYEELRLITLIHDSFKGLVDRTKPKVNGNNHADYAAQFAHHLDLPSNIIEIIRYHDEVYFSQRSNDIERLHRLIDRFEADLDLYTAFFICDTETGDKDTSRIQWFQEQIHDYLGK